MRTIDKAASVFTRPFYAGHAGASRGDCWHFYLFWSFWLFLALFPIGFVFREVMPIISFIFLILYYRHERHNSVLARLNPRPLFYCLWLMILIGIVCSNDPLDSLLHAGPVINKGFILPFIAMECVRAPRDLRRLVLACVVACFWEGLDGVWQTCSGHDFIMGYETETGRLTGSMGGYFVGNYIALAIIPAFGLWYILRQKLSAVFSAVVCIFALWPAFYLLAGASARAGMLSVATAFGLWHILAHGGFKSICTSKKIFQSAALAAAFLVLFFILSPRVLSDALFPVHDGRWSLWELGWRVFLEQPWFGAGAGQYNTAFRALGLVPAYDLITIEHPHNIYLDILYAHGIVGFCLGMLFLLGFACWGYKHILPHLGDKPATTANGMQSASDSNYWWLTAFFWIAFVGWLVNGLVGHNFYRMWYLALAMSYLGIMAGAIVNRP
ncbi:MAG: O-antigen ligase family protein [Desulfovibrio sp.]|jgi:O-antigen ligase|nr:O-antigen ligase family protein [Desulfovibrio sp.]